MRKNVHVARINNILSKFLGKINIKLLTDEFDFQSDSFFCVYVSNVVVGKPCLVVYRGAWVVEEECCHKFFAETCKNATMIWAVATQIVTGKHR